MFIALAAVLLGFAIGVVVFLYRGPSAYVQFAEPEQEIGEVCANAIVNQPNQMLVHGPAEISMTATIYNDVTGDAYLPLVESFKLAVDKDRTLTSPFDWKAPDLPLGAYTRILAGTVGGVAATTVTHFTIIDCPAS